MSRLVLRAGIALLLFCTITFGVPLVELWWSCRAPQSEACVWGRAYLSLSFVLWGIAGLLAAALAMVVRWRAQPGGGGQVD